MSTDQDTDIQRAMNQFTWMFHMYIPYGCISCIHKCGRPANSSGGWVLVLFSLELLWWYFRSIYKVSGKLPLKIQRMFSYALSLFPPLLSTLSLSRPSYLSYRSRDSSVGIGTGGGGSSSPGRVKNFHFSILSRSALGSTQSPTKWASGLFPGGKAAGAWSWPLTSN
jgi:hypothetical protein